MDDTLKETKINLIRCSCDFLLCLSSTLEGAEVKISRLFGLHQVDNLTYCDDGVLIL